MAVVFLDSHEIMCFSLHNQCLGYNKKATFSVALVAGRDSNPWGLHRNIWLHSLSSCELPVSACRTGPYRLH